MSWVFVVGLFLMQISCIGVGYSLAELRRISRLRQANDRVGEKLRYLTEMKDQMTEGERDLRLVSIEAAQSVIKSLI